MAFVILKSGKGATLPYEIAARMQSILDGRVQGTEAEQAKAAKIQKIYFAKPNTPDEATDSWTSLFPPRKDLE